MLNNQKSKKIFETYKWRLEKALTFYSKLQTHTPGYNYPLLAKKIWREGVLAEFWGRIATSLSSDGIDYLDNWRNGK